MSATRIRPLVAAAVLGLVVLSSCSTPAPPPAPPPPTTAPATTTPRPTTAPPPTTTPLPPLPQAADGSDTAACRDGTCEVRVGVGARITLPRRSGTEAEVTAIADGMVQLSGTWPGGSIESTGECSRCEASMALPNDESLGSFDARFTTGGGVKVNDYVLEAVAVSASEAVMRVRRA
ncbi:MAG: hypothetical protein ACRDQ0_22290 [Pseudonocardia sp.]